MKLSDFKSDVFSQFGEDGVVDYIFSKIGTGSKVCVEFGAGDGVSCSSTIDLWRNKGWNALLVEPDHARFEELEGNAAPFNAVCRRGFVSPHGPDSIDEILTAEGFGEVDYMSIDVDGDDYAIMAALVRRPRVIGVEFNPTIPPHLDCRQTRLGNTFGASLLSFIRLGESMGYSFVGATYCNAFFVVASESASFSDLEKDPTALFIPGEYTYAVSDFAGRIVLVGQIPPWGARESYVLPIEVSAYATQPTDNPRQIRRGFESLWGPSLLISPNGLSEDRFNEILSGRPRLVCVDLSTSNPDAVGWIAETAVDQGYEALQVGGVLGLVRKESNV